VTISGAGTGRTITTTRSGGSESGTSNSFNVDAASASVVLSNLSQAYTGSPLYPTATTSPAGLAITWNQRAADQRGQLQRDGDDQ